MVEQQHAQAALAGDAGSEQAGSAGADHDGIQVTHEGHCRAAARRLPVGITAVG